MGYFPTVEPAFGTWLIGSTSDFDDAADASVSASTDTSGTLTATWNAPFTEYGVGPAFAPVTGVRPLTDTDDFAFYTIDFAQSTFTLGQQGPETVTPGTRVTEVLTAIDQEGQPIDGLGVEFLRAGPSTEDSDGNDFDFTDEDGNAFYDFVGGSEGTARISAIVRDGGDRVISLDDTVVFSNGTPPPPPVKSDIVAKTKGRNNGAKADRVNVKVAVLAPGNIEDAQGATIRLFKVKGNKTGNKKTRVGTKTLDGRKVTFRIKDRNGNKKTRYFARVSATDLTNKGRSNNRGLR